MHVSMQMTDFSQPSGQNRYAVEINESKKERSHAHKIIQREDSKRTIANDVINGSEIKSSWWDEWKTATTNEQWQPRNISVIPFQREEYDHCHDLFLSIENSKHF